MKRSIFEQPWAGSCIRTDAVKTPELLIGYFIGPFGAMLSSGIFTSFLQAYLGDVIVPEVFRTDEETVMIALNHADGGTCAVAEITKGRK